MPKTERAQSKAKRIAINGNGEKMRAGPRKPGAVSDGG
jgi:hypothetical protein